jgi:hypothetical protein
MPVFADNAVAQFENTNALRNFPFAEGCSLVDREGRELPRDIVVDVHMAVPAIGDGQSPRVWLTSVHVSPVMVSAWFRSDMGGRTNALSVMVARDGFAPYRPYMLEKLYGAEDIGGVVTFGNIDFPGAPETYFMDDALLHPCCVAVAKPARLRSLVDRRSGKSLSGDVRVSFSGHVSAERNGKTFELSLDSGSAAELASECAADSGSGACGATPIVSINGVRPDSEGNIVLWFH